MREAGRIIDGIDLHHYMLTGNVGEEGSATVFTEAEWAELAEGVRDSTN